MSVFFMVIIWSTFLNNRGVFTVAVLQFSPLHYSTIQVLATVTSLTPKRVALLGSAARLPLELDEVSWTLIGPSLKHYSPVLTECSCFTSHLIVLQLHS